MYRKPVIVFEGIEGSGKSYHITNISNYLKKKKIDHIKIREPGGSLNAEKIRKLILNDKSNFNRKTDLLLYLAARNENIDLFKKNHKKKIILIDRFVDSTVAYQHYGFGIDLNLINLINSHILKSFKVDFTFLNIIDQKNMIKRLKSRKSLNRYDKFKQKFYLKVQNGFLTLAKKNKKKYKIIDSNLDKKVNKLLVINELEKLI
tara:strand:+ start:254 stop:865 length:612 start_codon:yes stop_codon:yes gene_type:complete